MASRPSFVSGFNMDRLKKVVSFQQLILPQNVLRKQSLRDVELQSQSSQQMLTSLA